jgi:hypothetical protein
MKQISEEEEKPFPSSSVDISLKDDITLGSSFMVKREAFSPKTRISNTSTNEIFQHFSIFVGHFGPPGSGSVSATLVKRLDYRSENHSVLDLTFLWCAL